MSSKNISPWAGSWSYRLYDILQPSRTRSPAPAISGSRYPPGEIWRHAFSVSIYVDLEALAEDSLHLAWRRFVRLEHFGLSGVILYEIHPRRPHSLNIEYQEHKSHELTLKSVFGDLNDPSDLGMDVDQLLDMVRAKVIYFPTYACTSFVVGQVMTAFLLDNEALQPYPAPQGFLIPCAGENGYQTLEDIDADTLARESDVHEPWDSYDFTSDDEDAEKLLSMEPDSPYRALCVRSSSLPHLATAGSYNDFGEEREDGNCTMSTVYSVGPRTPPLLQDKGGSSGSSPSKSGGLHASLSTGRLWLSLYDDLASFLDFSAAQVNA